MALPALALEQKLAASLSVSVSELRFTLCLFAAVPVGWCQRQIRSPTGAHVFAVVTGLLLIYLPFGNGVLHVVPPILSTFLSLHLLPNYCGTLVWLVCFPHLIYLHFVNASGAAWQDGALDATGALMILFLKLAAIAQCRQDAASVKDSSKELTVYQKQKMIHSTPSLLEYLSYLFCFGHLLSGPFSEFKDYKDYVERRELWSKELPSRWIPFIRVFSLSLLCLMAFVFVGMRYPFTTFFGDAYETASLGEKYLLTSAVCIAYRVKYYFAWGLAEAASVASGYGYSGTDSEENGGIKHKWERCRNINVLQTEFATSFAKLPANWNICTGAFLRRYVYDRLTPVGGKPTFVTLLATQLISAIWHGLYPGYFMFFASASIGIEASKVLHRWEQRSSLATTYVYIVAKLLFAMLTLNYTASAFLVLSFNESMHVYASMKFIPHIICFTIFCAAPFVPRDKSVAKSTTSPIKHTSAAK